MGKIDIYTDGSYFKLHNRGGFGIIAVKDGEEFEFKKGFQNTTSNRMELRAVVTALEKLEAYVDNNEFFVILKFKSN